MEGLTARLARQMGEKVSGLNMAIDPETFVRNFGGQVLRPNSPLPDSGKPENHAEFDVASPLRIDHHPFVRPRNLRTLVSIATARLGSIPPRTKERADQVARMHLETRETLEAIDNLVGVLEEEHFQAIVERWEKLQARGRELRESFLSLQEKINNAMMAVNAAEEHKSHCKVQLQSHHYAAGKLGMDRFRTEKEIAAADGLVASDRVAMEQASEQALKAQQALGEAENVLRLAQAELQGIVIAMDRAVCELNGTSYHDPQTGLSVDPRNYQDNW